MAQGVNRVYLELSRLGVQPGHIIISTDIRVQRNGNPYSSQPEPKDTGAAVYWKRRGKQESMGIDRYTRVADNLGAIAATLGYLRGVERHGGAAILERVFTGFEQLPQPMGWREIFQSNGVILDRSRDAGESLLAYLRAEYRKLAMLHHPDRGGNAMIMGELNQAMADAERELLAQ